MLREPKGTVRRADLIIYTRCTENGSRSLPDFGVQFCSSRHILTDGIPLTGGESFSLESLRGRKLLVFAGIAEPQSFFDGLRSCGLDVVHILEFPDHACYDSDRIHEIEVALRACNAEYVLTTEKDGVKLTHLPQYLAEKILIARLELRITDPAILESLLRNLLQN
jgi:tetraacyldisaccharide 4'-kinase